MKPFPDWYNYPHFKEVEMEKLSVLPLNPELVTDRIKVWDKQVCLLMSISAALVPSSSYCAVHFWEPKKYQCSCWGRWFCSMSASLLTLCPFYMWRNKTLGLWMRFLSLSFPVAWWSTSFWVGGKCREKPGRQMSLWSLGWFGLVLIQNSKNSLES